MLLDFHDRLRSAGLRISLNEWLTMLGGLSKNIGTLDLDKFYVFSRLCLIKDETLYDRFDQVFKDYWAGREQQFDAFSEALSAQIPEHWLASRDMPELSEEQRAAVEALDRHRRHLTLRPQWLQPGGYSYWYPFAKRQTAGPWRQGLGTAAVSGS